MTTSKPILFFGNERLATGLGTTAPALRGLLEAGYNVAAIIVAQNETAKSRKTRPLEVALLADKHGIPVLSPANLTDAADQIKAYGAPAAVLAAYGKIVPRAILELFPVGVINIHPSLLPLHRGSTPIESVLLQGEVQTGVSLMRLAPQMDAGPVYAQATVLLTGSETKQQLATQLSDIGAQLLLTHLPDILSGTLQPVAQDDSRATYDSSIQKSDADLDFNKTAEQLARQVRAYAGWPRSRCTIGTHQLIITAAHAIAGESVPGTLWLDGKQIGLHCQDGILVLDRLIPPGKPEMAASAYLAGYKPMG